MDNKFNLGGAAGNKATQKLPEETHKCECGAGPFTSVQMFNHTEHCTHVQEDTILYAASGLRTFFNCPHCDDEQELDGDKRGSVVTCNCGKDVEI